MSVKFSVIMPAYNVEKYIGESIDSILGQNYSSFELIIIDDGSTDNTREVCEEYAKIDKRIKFVHKTNGGLSSARNRGLQIAKGEYVLFIDSDDYWCDYSTLKKINSIIESTRGDLIVFSFEKVYKDDSKLVKNNKSKSKFVFDCCKEKIMKYLIEKNIYKACAWNKCVKKEIIDINHMNFPEGYLNEDIIWCAELLVYCENIQYINEIFYAYRQGRKESITSNRSIKNVSDRVSLIYQGIQKCENEFVLNYYAYEYCVSLGLLYGIKDKKIEKQIDELCFLLRYDLNRKVHMVNLISKVIGFENVRRLMCVFVKLKRS